MATSHVFDGKVYKLPGAYAATKADITPEAVAADYGNVLVIDTGSNKGWGSGSGVLGELSKGKNSIYRMRSASDFRNFVKGGPLYPLGKALFEPSNIRGTAGAASVQFISAKESTAAKMTLLVGEKKIVFSCRAEGEWGNGVLSKIGRKDLIQGYALRVTAGSRDKDKRVIEVLQGEFTGINPLDNLAYNELEEEQSVSRLVIRSGELATVGELIRWVNTNSQLKDGFVINTEDISSLDNEATLSAILEPTAELLLASGGTETYSPKAFEAALEACKNINAYFILSDTFSNTGNNLQLQHWAGNENRFAMVLIVAVDEEDGTKAISAAKAFNDESTRVVYDRVRINSLTNIDIKREYSALIHAGYLVGREAGLLPQIPMTFKEIGIDGLVYNADENLLTDFLDAGVMTSYYDEDLERFVCLKGINTLQNNDLIVNPDGTTHSIQCRRIADYVNKELITDAKKQLLSQRDGVTITSLSPTFFGDWIGVQLKKKQQRNLIAKYLPESISVERQKDGYYVSYKFAPNYEINFLFMTGFMIN